MCLEFNSVVKHPGTEDTEMVAWKVMRQFEPGRYTSVIKNTHEIMETGKWYEAKGETKQYEEKAGYQIGFHAYRRKSDAYAIHVRAFYEASYIRVVKVVIRKWTAFGKQQGVSVVVGKEMKIIGKE